VTLSWCFAIGCDGAIQAGTAQCAVYAYIVHTSRALGPAFTTSIGPEREAPDSDAFVIEHDHGTRQGILGDVIEVREDQRCDLGRAALLLSAQEQDRRPVSVRGGEQFTGGTSGRLAERQSRSCTATAA
jgi:hypothetical protein